MEKIIVSRSNQTIHIAHSGKFEVILNKPGTHVEISGHFLGQQKDEVNVELYIVHQAPHTSANTVLKGVAQDQSQIRFFGRIKIEPNCPDTQSFLEERILILSDQAKAEAVPELEILSDDVKCSHAASMSKIPQEHLFYLMSRGLPQKQAEQLIVEGFLGMEEEDGLM